MNEYIYKVKVKFAPRRGHDGPEGKQRYSSTLSLTSALDEDMWLMPRPGRFTRGNDPVHILQDAEWVPGSVWKNAENLTPPEFDPLTLQPVTSRYTD